MTRARAEEPTCRNCEGVLQSMHPLAIDGQAELYQCVNEDCGFEGLVVAPLIRDSRLRAKARKRGSRG